MQEVPSFIQTFTHHKDHIQVQARIDDPYLQKGTYLCSTEVSNSTQQYIVYSIKETEDHKIKKSKQAVFALELNHSY